MKTSIRPLRERRFLGDGQDPYKAERKLESPTVCPECHAVFQKGRWHWLASPPVGAARRTCQACLRIRDKYPAGRLSLKGAFVKAHRAELIAIAHNEQERENKDRPLHRIMAISDQPEGLLITTTDIHLPRRIGEAIRRAHEGELRVHYDRGGYAVRVDWGRQ